MTIDVLITVQRLVDASNALCDEPPRAGASEKDILLVKKKFASWNFPLPTMLLEIWRATAGLPRHAYDESLLKAPFGRRSLSETETDQLAPYDIERYGILNLGNGRDVSFTMNRDARTSLDVMTYDIHPESFPYSFEKGFAKYVEAVEAEVAGGTYEDEEES